MMKPPIFIIGSPRSGTTLFRLMITAHPAIVVPPECGFAVWWATKYGDWSASDIETRTDEFLRDLQGARKFETWEMDMGALKAEIRAQVPGSYAALVSLVYEAYGQQKGRTFERWGDKNNFYLNHIPELHGIFPQAQFLHIVRDGRDVACSYRELGRKKSDSQYAPRLETAPEAIATEWAGNVSKVATAFARLPDDLAYTVRYEDLVRDAEGTLKGVCAFLQEPFSAQMLAYHELNRTQQLEPAEFLQWKAKTLEAPTDSQVGRYLRDLSPEERSEFERVAQSALQNFGYL